MNKLIKSTIILFTLTIISKIIGFGRETILVSTYGASMISDVYITSMKIPTTLFAIIASALSSIFIPKFCEIEKNEDSESALLFSNNLINIIIAVSLLLSIAGFIFTEPLVKLFAMDFSGEKLDLTLKFTKILVPTMIFIGISDIMTCWLQIKGMYNVPAIIGIPFNIIIITSIIVSSKGNLMILAIGSLIAISSKLIFQIPFAYKSGYKYKLYINFKDDNIKKAVILLLPVVVGVGANQINSIVDSTLASTLGDGIITVLNSADRLVEFVTTLFITTIVSIIYPIFSKLSNEEDSSEFKNIIKKSLNIIIIIIIPISVGAIVLATPIVKILFERGEFNSNSTMLTAQALRCYAIGIPAMGTTTILNRIFYSLKDTKTPMFMGVISIIVNIVLSLILINFMGYIGLAIATSIAAIVKLILLFRSLKERLYNYDQRHILKTFIKVISAASVMGSVVYLLYTILNNIMIMNTSIYMMSILLLILTGAFIYVYIIINMNIEEVKFILNTITLSVKNKY